MTTVESRRPIELGARIDGPDKVTGSARYAADLTRPGMLWGRVLRSPLPHARIVSVDTSRARALPGVHAVLTGQDIPPEVRVGRNMRDMPVLAREKVRFIGEKVAAVAAESEEIAEAALALIEVQYAELPAVFDPLEAIKPDAPVLHDPALVRAWAEGKQVVPDYPNGASAPSWGASEEEVQRALAAADYIFEHTFHTPSQHQMYLETHACLVELDEAGVAHIWASNKAPLLLTGYLEAGLGLRRDQVAIHMLPLGGDFGGKGSFMDIPLAYFLARASGRPVKIVMSMVEELTAANPRHGATVVVRSGVMADGRVVARWLRGYMNSGAYAAFKPSTDTTLPGFPRGAIGPYDIPVLRSECHMIYTNTTPAGHMRSPGEVQTTYAVECHTELIARAMGIDPVAFRLKNGSHHGRPSELSDASVAPPIPRILNEVTRAIGLDQERPPNVGRGVALLEFSTTAGVYSAILAVDTDGQVIIQTPIVENGAGMLTVFRQIVAEEFGVPVDQVTVRQSIDNLEVDRGVGGSRVTRLEGKLLIELSKRLQQRLAELVAAEFGAAAEEVSAGPDGFTLPDGRRLSLKEAASLAHAPLVESMTFRATGKDKSVTFLAQGAEVHVDPETGQVTPLRLVSVHEVGRIINPMLFRTQIASAVMQGLGYALMEEIERDEQGRVTTTNLNEYKIPTMEDAPPLEAILLEPEPGLGITPVGEGANAGVPPAIVNAVVDAIGPRTLDVPLRPEVILSYLRDGSETTNGRA